MTPEQIGAALEVELESGPEFDLGGGLRWRPTLGSLANRLAVYVCDTDEVGPAIGRRIAAARAAGLRTVVAVGNGVGGLTIPLQAFLLETGVEVAIPSEADLNIHADIARYAQSQKVLLEPSLSRAFIVHELRRATTVTGVDRGRSLERALAFMTSQVPYWAVRDVNFRTANEEIDILVANSSARSPWNGSAYLLIESKNWSSNVDRDEYDTFHMKVKERGGSCRLGLFFAAVGFSSGFFERAAHHGSEGFSIVPMSIPRLIEAIEAIGSVEDALIARVERVVLDRAWEE